MVRAVGAVCAVSGAVQEVAVVLGAVQRAVLVGAVDVEAVP